jgi:hypothetical protein
MRASRASPRDMIRAERCTQGWRVNLQSIEGFNKKHPSFLERRDRRSIPNHSLVTPGPKTRSPNRVCLVSFDIYKLVQILSFRVNLFWTVESQFLAFLCRNDNVWGSAIEPLGIVCGSREDDYAADLPEY